MMTRWRARLLRRWIEIRWDSQFWPSRAKRLLGRTTRVTAQAWWRCFGERCICGASWQRKDRAKRMNLCCFALALTRAMDQVYEARRQRSGGAEL